MKPLSEFEAKVGITFKDKSILERAFTHRSYINEHPGTNLRHNERLEFLGDAVLELVITHYLFEKYPDTPEGELTAYRSALVRTESISDAASKLGMNDYLLLSKGEAKDTGKAREYILANTFEACIGAIYMDQGYEVARDFIGKSLYKKIDDIVEHRLWKDPKSYVQEKVQEIFSVTPSYEVISEEGPDHDRNFVAAILFGDEQVATGEGKSKQEAQQNAAQAAIEKHGW